MHCRLYVILIKVFDQPEACHPEGTSIGSDICDFFESF